MSETKQRNYHLIVAALVVVTAIGFTAWVTYQNSLFHYCVVHGDEMGSKLKCEQFYTP